MSCSLNSLKGLHRGYLDEYERGMNTDSRSLDYSSSAALSSQDEPADTAEERSGALQVHDAATWLLDVP